MKRNSRLGIFWMAGMLFAAGSGAGIHWTAPADWKPQAERPMRLATYSILAAPGDQEGGECIVSYFGQGQGGATEANLDRWSSQFLQPDGQPSKNAKVSRSTVHGLKVATIDVAGTYTGMGGPRAQGAPKPGYRLLGAVVEGPQGSVFFKFTGPSRTVARNQSQFDKLIASLGPQ